MKERLKLLEADDEAMKQKEKGRRISISSSLLLVTV